MTKTDSKQKTCVIEGCDSPQHYKGYKDGPICVKHYARLRRNGCPLTKKSRASKFLPWLKGVVENPPVDCVEYPFALNDRGYGRIYNKGHHGAHRVALVLYSGPPANPDMLARHKCKNKACCNPLHLEWGTTLENALDRVRDKTLPIGEKNANSKISSDDAIFIAENTNIKTRVLCEKFGISRQIISDIRRGKTWSHVTGIERQFKSCKSGKYIAMYESKQLESET